MARRVSRANLTDTLLRDLRRLVVSARGRFFTRPKPPEPALVLDLETDDVERILGEAHFAPNWDMSFAYFGEVLNLRRVEYVPDHPLGYRWWQVHVRGYHHPRGIEVTAHFETDPSESPDAHVDRVGIDIEHGLETLKSVLESSEIDYEETEPPDSRSAAGNGSSGESTPDSRPVASRSR